MNLAGLVILGVAVVLIIIGFRGTQAATFHSLTGH